MAVTETREIHQANWLERMGSSFKGVVTGLVLIVLSAGLLFWNEGRAVKTARSLDEGAGAAVSADKDKVDSANEGKLVHVMGRADTKDELSDAQFGLSATAIKLSREVEVFQWVEHKDVRQEKQGDKVIEKTTYTYKKEWCSKPVDSSAFKEAGHENPAMVLPFSDQDQYAQTVMLGAYKLSESNVKRIHGTKPFAFPEGYKPPEALVGASFVNGVIYVPAARTTTTTTATAAAPATGGSPLLAAARAQATAAVTNAVNAALRDVATAPQVGDLRVKFTMIEPHDISICEKQVGNSFTPWTASNGRKISLQQDGLAEAAAMFEDAQKSNTMLTWILRLVGFFLMFSGFKGIFGPLATLVDVIPVIRSIVSGGVSFVSFLLALAGSTITAGIAWIVYRPVVGIALLVVAGACVALVIMKKGKAAPAK